MFGNTGEHSRPDFLAVMKRKHEIRPALAGHGAVRASLPFDARQPMASKAARTRLAFAESQ